MSLGREAGVLHGTVIKHDRLELPTSPPAVNPSPSCNWLLEKLDIFQAFHCSFWVCFSKIYVPQKAGKKNTQNCKIPKCSDLVDFRMMLPISICEFDAEHILDAFKHVPSLFRMLRDWKTRKTLNVEKLKTHSEKTTRKSWRSPTTWWEAPFQGIGPKPLYIRG